MSLRGRLLPPLIFGALLLAILASDIIPISFDRFTRLPGPLPADKIVLIERGSSLTRIAEQLEREGVLADTWLFRLLARGMDASKVQAGEYLLPARISVRAVLDKLERGEVFRRKITIPEGLTRQEIAARLRAEPALSGDITQLPAEGYLLPETYDFTRGDTRQGLINRMQAALEKTLKELWAARAQGLPLATPHDALTLAAIVEKETGIAAERPRVAGVFINRLRKGMKLQADPTVIYALTKGEKPLGRPLYRKDWEFPSPYNTYYTEGLPPGPVANPGRASIAAALNPEAHNLLYFVADGTGGHVFAATLEEHNRNVAAWRAHQAQRP